MEIHALRITLTEQDLNALAKKNMRSDSPVENIQVQIAPEGVTVKGVYPMFVNVNFEAQWELGVKEGKLSARLVSLRALGMPGNIFKSALMKVIADGAKGNDGIHIQDDTLWADLNKLIAREGLGGQVYLNAIVCLAGQITFEAGSRAAESGASG